ncbi:M28 family peptidase [Robiginitalea sp.]|nr:M28 family peptidase [Robiginitalea sp.]
MKTASAYLSLFILLLIAYSAFKFEMPQYRPDIQAVSNVFSVDRALAHVKEISEKPHGVGFDAHQEVAAYLLEELKKLGLETELQTGYTAGDWGNLSKATNILARIPGKRQGPALLLLSHYDSSPHASYGASDAGSGVAVILEGIHAYLSGQESPQNDIIILFSDAEELGLNGADLFVREHPWAKNIGLALNFEARGSGGPGYMLIETNGGNANLIEAFTAAKPNYPVANSLAYSIYKMLPNDTDLTVFREVGNIPGFNFAFIDDHFDYHTALDTYDRLDRNTLAHQGSYLMPLLTYFSKADLSQLDTAVDEVYFNLPFLGLMHYPNSWIWPMFLLVVLLFTVILGFGIHKRKISIRGILMGFIPLLLVLLMNGVLGYFAWPVLTELYPQYSDVLHGFTYNGYLYITAFAALAAGNCFLVYSFGKKVQISDALVGPILIWLLLCGLLNTYLPGAAFFILPVLTLIAALGIRIYDPRPNTLLFTFMTIPALWIFAPFVKMFPVGLGLKLLISSTLLTTLIFFLILGTVLSYPNRKNFAVLGWIIGLALLGMAHYTSNFNSERPKPSSLVYILDSDSQSARWASYDAVLTPWNEPFVTVQEMNSASNDALILSSKYATGFSKSAPAPIKELPAPITEVIKDTIYGEARHVALNINPQRPINRLEVFTNDTPIIQAKINGIALSEFYLAYRQRNKLITHYVSANDATTLELVFPKSESLTLTLVEASNDLLSHPEFNVPKRPDTEIPMPFVLNDAIVILKTVRFE